MAKGKKKKQKMKTNNTKVYVRFRPANQREIDSTDYLDDINDKRNYACEINEDDNTHETVLVNDSYKTREYVFDHAFSRYDTQTNVYRNTTSSLISNLLNGKNSSIMCYGQTGSGKTYTLFGYDGTNNNNNNNMMDIHDGIVPRAIDDLFYKIQQTEIPGEIEYQVEVSFVQIYNEKVQDLLLPQQFDLPVRMVEQESTGELDWVTAAAFLPVATTYELMTQVKKGLKNRTVRSTSMNKDSSRSHAILKVRCRKLEINTGSVYTSVFDFVDLAGSEKASKSLVIGDGFKEASYINKSLLHLKNVIKALSLLKKNQARPRVIYRNSVLTKLLYQTLGGNSESGLVLCASPHIYNLRETMSTLRFGTIAKNVKSKPKVNYVMSIDELRKATGACVKRIELQQICIIRKQKEVNHNKKLMMQMIAKLDRNSSTYKEIKRRFAYLFINMREDTRFGNMFVPEVVLGKIFEYTGVFSISKCVTVCKEWKNFLLNDSNPIVNYLWKHVAINEGFLNGMATTKRKEFDEEVASSSSSSTTTTNNNNNKRKDSGSGGGGLYRKLVCDNLIEKFRRIREASRAKFSKQIKNLKGGNDRVTLVV